MAVRNKRPCKNCPQSPDGEQKVNAKGINYTVTYVGPQDQGEKLWKHVLFGTGTCINMIEGYAKMQMPGDPLPGLKELRDRLNVIIETLGPKK